MNENDNDNEDQRKSIWFPAYKLIEVWIDLENMYGSTTERMAQAIENSQFI